MLEPQKTAEQLADFRGAAVYDSCGERIGRVEEIYDDTPTARPQWIGIGTGLLGMKQVVVPSSWRQDIPRWCHRSLLQGASQGLPRSRCPLGRNWGGVRAEPLRVLRARTRAGYRYRPC